VNKCGKNIRSTPYLSVDVLYLQAVSKVCCL